jgi:hypothetical protein
MKSLSTFLFFFIVFVSTAFGQKIRFTDTTNTWFVVYSFLDNNPTGPPYQIYYHNYSWGSDTFIHNIKYRKLRGMGIGLGPQAPNMICAVREDIPAKKVYARFLTYATADTVERVLYDYNLQLHDTLKQVYANVQYTSWVTEIDSVVINGVYHKLWHFWGSSLGTDDYVLEGVGSLSAPWFPMWPYLFENRHILSCFTNNGSHPLVTPKAAQYFDNATSCTLDVGSLQQKIQSANMVPNPATRASEIWLGQTIQKGRLIVYDALGRTVYKAEINSTSRIPVGAHLTTPGQYFYRVTDTDRNQSYTGKFIFE